MSKPRFNWKLPGALLALAILSTGAWIGWPALQAPPPEEAPSAGAAADAPVRLEVVAARAEDLSLWTEATGRLRAWRQVEVSPEIGGQVVELAVEEGQWVEAGDELLKLDDRELLLQLEDRKLELLKAQANHSVQTMWIEEPDSAEEPSPSVEELAAAYQRAEERFKQGLVSQSHVEELRRQYEFLAGTRRTEVQAAVSGLAQAEQSVRQARLMLEQATLVAPVAGRVADLDVEVGQHLMGNQSCLVLLDDRRLKVDVEVLESAFYQLRESAPVRIRVPALGDLSFQGEVENINPRIDAASGTGRVRITLANPDQRLKAGSLAFVDLETQRLPDRLVVPTSALLVRQGRDLVFRVEEGRAKWTYVTVGARSRQRAEILEGLEEGDLVAVSGHLALAHDTRVDVVKAD